MRGMTWECKTNCGHLRQVHWAQERQEPWWAIQHRPEVNHRKHNYRAAGVDKERAYIRTLEIVGRMAFLFIQVCNKTAIFSFKFIHDSLNTFWIFSPSPSLISFPLLWTTLLHANSCLFCYMIYWIWPGPNKWPWVCTHPLRDEMG